MANPTPSDAPPDEHLIRYGIPFAAFLIAKVTRHGHRRYRGKGAARFYLGPNVRDCRS